MKYSQLVVIPIFLFLLFSVGEFGYSLPTDRTDDSEHSKKSLETRQEAFPGFAGVVCKSTLLLYVIILLVNEFYLLVGALVLAAIGFGFFKLGENIKNCEKKKENEITFTQAIVANLSGEQPKFNVMVYHDDSSIVNFHNYSTNSTELHTHCFGETITYNVYLFEWGDFTLAGDGGYENWAFYGSFTRNGPEVTFYSMNPTIP